MRCCAAPRRLCGAVELCGGVEVECERVGLQGAGGSATAGDARTAGATGGSDEDHSETPESSRRGLAR